MIAYVCRSVGVNITRKMAVVISVSRHFGPRTPRTQDISALVSVRHPSAPVPNCPDISALPRHFGTNKFGTRKTIRHQATLDQTMARRTAMLA